MLAAVETQQPLASVEEEAALLGALMREASLVDPIADRVTADDFFEPLHGRIFTAILKLHAEGRIASPITLRPYFHDDPAIKELGGPAYLVTIMGTSGAEIIGARDFARSVADFAKRRRLIDGLVGVIGDARSADVAVDKLVEAADGALTKALSRTQAVATVSLAQSFDTTLQAIEDEAAGLGPQGIHIDGLSDFNELTGDLRRGELMYLGGRPSMGKTALSLGIALGAAKTGNGVSMISLEMRAAELTTRAMTDLVFDYGQDCPTFEQVRRGRLSDKHRELLRLARRQIDQWPLLITDPPSLNIGRLSMEIRRQRRRLLASGQKLDLVIVDYLGLIKGSDQRAKRYEEVGEISRTLKQVAKECDVAMVVLAQLNRECERRDDKRPMLSDLRDAGDVEQDADHVMFVYRDEYYLERSEPEPHDKKRGDWEIAIGHSRDKIELIAAKVRNGRVGKRTCHFFGRHQAVRASDYLSARR